MADLYLASKSPRRRELLEQIGVSYEAIDVDVQEQICRGELPVDYVRRLAMEKALAGLTYSQTLDRPQLPVLGADTLIELNGSVLEKPRDREHGIAMLLALSGRKHKVLSAVAIASTGESRSSSLCDCLIAETVVSFREFGEPEAARYWQSGEPVDKAGGYGIQGLGAIFVNNIDGSYSGVVGLPLTETWQLLERYRVPYWGTVERGKYQ